MEFTKYIFGLEIVISFEALTSHLKLRFYPCLWLYNVCMYVGKATVFNNIYSYCRMTTQPVLAVSVKN